MTDALRLDRARRRLCHDGRLFEPGERRWSATADTAGGRGGPRPSGADATRLAAGRGRRADGIGRGHAQRHLPYRSCPAPAEVVASGRLAKRVTRGIVKNGLAAEFLYNPKGQLGNLGKFLTKSL